MKSKQQLASSLRELARSLDRPHQVVSRWVKHEKWDQPRRPPWNVERARAWAAATLPPDPATAWNDREADEPTDRFRPGDPGGVTIDALRKTPLTAARLKLTLVRAQFLELQKAILSGEYVPRKDIETALVRRAYAVRATFEGIPRQIAGRLVGLDEVAIEQALDEAVRNACLEMSRMTVLPSPPKDTEVET